MLAADRVDGPGGVEVQWFGSERSDSGDMIDLDAVSVADLERDPYPVYAELRTDAPVAWMPCLGAWMITRHADVDTACNDPERFPATVDDSPTDRALGGPSMMTTDGEPSRSRNRPYFGTFRPRAVEAAMPEVFTQLCSQRLDAIAEAGSADLVADYFEPVSVMSLAHALDIGEFVDPPTLTRWFAGLAAGVSNYEADPAKTAFSEEVGGDIDVLMRHRFAAVFADPDDGILSTLINATDGPFEERLAWVMPSFKLVLLGGLQEPAHGGATVTHCLLADESQLRDVREVPELIKPAVEEGLRWTAPIGNLLRSIAPGTELGGVTFDQPARAVVVVASANRDETVWGPTADVFDLHRPRRNHLAFAAGPHYCLGHHFARVQLRVAVGMLIERFPDLHLDPEHDVVYRGHEYRSPTSLRVLVE